ncbi:phosphotransferase family protein [Ectothiorhodospiraceae bacterium WFHF3C12]|nr:phosphotransferase family protein [Ectothiorhodospiraceae bacterium WFHF3C12]
MSEIDQATGIRAGEELDADALKAYFHEHVPELDGQLEIAQFPGGASNLTYQITVDGRDYVLRRPPFGSKVRSAHDMGREYNVLSRLQPVFPYAPRPIVHCTDESVIGAEFYVMERIRGLIIRKDLPAGMSLSPDEARQLCESLLDVQAELHGIDLDKAGMHDFGKPAGYVARQVNGWSERYRAAKTGDVPDCEPVMAWLQEKMPADKPERAAVIHNDYKFDNVVLDPDNPFRVIGVLDWEMATVGDPVMDLGCTLGYWVEKDDPEPMQQIRRMPTNLDGMPSRRELVERYQEKTGFQVDDFDFYHVFGMFRLAVIAQQIYRRYVDGKTQDRRFASLGMVVQVLNGACERVIDRSAL